MVEQAHDLHVSVLLNEVIEYLRIRSDGVYVDGTLGLGGHTEAILKASVPKGRVIAFDWDEKAIEIAKKRLAPFDKRLHIVRRNFAELAEGLREVGVTCVDGIIIDIGLSSLQLDKDDRGFSFMRDEPLDMRMDTRSAYTAAKLIADSSEEELADILYYYGEERQARAIARQIVRERKCTPIVTSKQLANTVVKAIPKRFHPKRIHVATKTFQAIRIAVNRELENLAEIIEDAAMFLVPGGRLCVISFHSLEDRIVKRKFLERPDFCVVTKKPVIPSETEMQRNPRSRSAKLRVAYKKEF